MYIYIPSWEFALVSSSAQQTEIPSCGFHPLGVPPSCPLGVPPPWDFHPLGVPAPWEFHLLRVLPPCDFHLLGIPSPPPPPSSSFCVAAFTAGRGRGFLHWDKVRGQRLVVPSSLVVCPVYFSFFKTPDSLKTLSILRLSVSVQSVCLCECVSVCVSVCVCERICL